jgi:hypothetical protein
MQFQKYIKRYPKYKELDDCFKLGILFEFIQMELSKAFSINTYQNMKKNISNLEGYIKNKKKYYHKEDLY